MTPERYKEVGQLYRAALEVEPERRAAFLAEACSGDETLRQEVESLFGYEAQRGGLIDQPALEIAAQTLAKEQAGSPVGQNLGHYRILSLLGKGGMGEVYRARDTKLDRTVALKLLPAELAANQERMRRFVREAKAASALNHPHVATIYEIGEGDGISFIAMEYIEGQTLAAEINGRPLDAAKIIEIGIQVADALDEAHSKGITHRDIKPANLMLTPRGQVKVLDFGLAKVAHSAGLDEMSQLSTLTETTPGVVMGTVAYMSPEQALGHEVDQRTDIFSVGAVIYEMATGQQPFRGATASETIDRILHAQPEAIAHFNDQAPAELERIVGKCLEKEREARYQTAAEVRDDLTRLRGLENTERTTLLRSLGQMMTAGRRAIQMQSSWRRLALAGIALVILLLGMVMSVYLLSGREKVNEAPASGLGPATDSLAVLPFVNGSADANMEYLSDGITEGIINSLSQLPQLRVMARSTVFNYKGKQVDPRKVGQELHVRAVLTGRVLQRDGDLLIGAELVNVADGSQLWGEQSSWKQADVIRMPTEIAQRISEKLHFRLTEEGRKRLLKRYTENTAAYHLYLKGRYYLEKWTEEDFKRGLDCFKQALDLDPNYSLAYAGLSDAYHWLSTVYLPPKEAMPKSRAAAMKALELDETLAEAHTALATVAIAYDWDWKEAERAYKQAIKFNPGYAPAHHGYGIYLVLVGRPAEAQVELKRAQEFDPLSTSIAVTAVWPFYFAPPPARQYDRAIEELRRIIALDSGFFPAHVLLGHVYTQKGMHGEAIEEFTKAAQLDNAVGNLGDRGYAFGMAGKREEAQRILGDLLERVKRREFVPALGVALVYIGLGEKAQALAWLEKAYEERDEELAFYIKVDPRFDSLRADSRFIELIRLMNYPP